MAAHLAASINWSDGKATKCLDICQNLVSDIDLTSWSAWLASPPQANTPR